jgi:uncharacterized protein (DUF697 family)
MIEEEKIEVQVDIEDLIEENKVLRANEIVKNNIIASMGVSTIPIPVVDLVGLSTIQLNMIHSLCALYEQDFSKSLGKSFIGSLVGSLGAVPIAAGFASLIKTIPVFGQSIGAISMPFVGGATTYAMGKVFIQHFESGGTFLDFNPTKVKEYFKEQFQNGKNIVNDIKPSASEKPNTTENI